MCWAVGRRVDNLKMTTMAGETRKKGEAAKGEYRYGQTPNLKSKKNECVMKKCDDEVMMKPAFLYFTMDSL